MTRSDEVRYVRAAKGHGVARAPQKKPAAMALFFLLAVVLLANSLTIKAQEVIDSVEVKVIFPVAKTAVLEDFQGNGERLGDFLRKVREAETDATRKVSLIKVVGYASPEGGHELNQRLAAKRATAMADYLREHMNVGDSLIEVRSAGIDWEGLDRALADSELKQAAKVRYIIRHEPELSYDSKGRVTGSRKKTLMDLDGGRTWNWMMKHVYPSLRSSASVVCYIEELPAPEPVIEEEPVMPADTLVVEEEPWPEPEPVVEVRERKPFYMSIHTNMLYDAAALPNLGVEFYLGKNYSIQGNWVHGWWSKNSRHRYYRAYGGILSGRYWFGKQAKAKPLTGHHAGVYAALFIYDFEFGGKGYMGGEPHGRLFDHPSYSFGVEYGFALPVARRLNIDFTLGLGYFGGRYYVYNPMDDHYVWKETRQRHWWGPTRAEISLVWLLGHGNVNAGKGGGR